ncbi:MAG: phage tail tube protein [Pseudorhodoplanes sp.]|uniref:phage tail tube protein n=1 Tax=Pseudorhodoplanes sp. TaxID=1934341 RepID=UPI003D118795
MPTAAAPKGKLAELALKDETTYGTAATGNYQKTLIYEDSLDDPEAYEPDPILGAAQHNARDPHDQVVGLPAGVSGNIVVPLDLNHLWFWLKGAFGAPVTTGSGSDYVHTFASGGEVLPHRTIERKAATSLFFQHTGALVNSLAFEASRRAGYDRVTVGLLGRKQGKITSTGAGTPPAMLARDPVLAFLPVLKIDTVAVADVISASLTFDNGAAPQDYLGDSEGRPTGHDLDNDASLTGQIRLRFRTAAMYDLAKAKTFFAHELLWQKSATRSLSLQAPRARLEPAGVPVTGPGRIEQSFNLVASQSSSAAMFTAVLKNALAAASYA